MQEKINQKLIDHRFIISPESTGMMKEAREMLNLLHEKYPEVLAMSFYGSRIHGREKKSSDIDSFVLFDNNKRIDKEVCNDKNIIQDIRDFEKNIKEKYPNFDLDRQWLDISEDGTKEDFEFFKKEPWKGEFGESSEHFGHEGMPYGHVALVARFLLSVGNIYKAREFLFDLLEKEKDGERYFGILMQRLKEIERPEEIKYHEKSNIPPFHYPNTIADGRKYFLSNKKINEK